ncbi:Dps family protein [Zophobihabitans entericus]|uniref:DNA starvation/stationary phase protection protein n=1 Tax=Zophobihabitans entericus TaxID=1635327 RepID=A0A6G9I7W8_9GAMM|nr:DNA starvation/stationary phase protection protein [Zophobihabitans entericus]QIQ20303.1 DNA starvation/stationary phase protection protein [Zophobihabitans entericus]
MAKSATTVKSAAKTTAKKAAAPKKAAPVKAKAAPAKAAPAAAKKVIDKAKVQGLQRASLVIPTDLGKEASRDISAAMNAILADVFALYLKTKNFHWHVSGPHFRDFHLMFDEQGAELFAMTDAIAERVRKLGGMTLRSIGHIAKLQRIDDNDANYVEPSDMLAELCQDNIALVSRLREAHNVCDQYNDTGTSGLIDGWLDEAERRAWFLFEAGRKPDSSGH